MSRFHTTLFTIGTLLCLWARGAIAQELTPDSVAGLPSERHSFASSRSPAIGYLVEPFDDAVAALNRRLESGGTQLTFDAETGYLKSVLDALKLSTKSQLLVYSKTSVQATRISPANPRALYFSDDAAVGYIRGAPFIEFAILDPKKGVGFYTLEQRPSSAPRMARAAECRRCHESPASMGIPGMILRSVPTGPDGLVYQRLANYATDHRSPIAQRWGGWYVTGNLGRAEHMGNVLVRNPDDADVKLTSNELLASLESRFDQRGYLTPFSDVAALLVFEHQVHMIDLLVRVGWEAQVALAAPANATNAHLVQTLLANGARELVDYLLFVDEAPFPDAVAGSYFATEFASRGPFDRKGRSLRQLDLSHRLLRYPCSYMIYSNAFDALPREAKAAIYERLWAVLSGKVHDRAYGKLSAADRRAVIEILRDTKTDLPGYFRTGIVADGDTGLSDASHLRIVGGPGAAHLGSRERFQAAR